MSGRHNPSRLPHDAQCGVRGNYARSRLHGQLLSTGSSEPCGKALPPRRLRQRRFFGMDGGDAAWRGMVSTRGLDALLSLAGTSPIHARSLGGDTGRARSAFPAQRQPASGVAFRTEGCAALAHGRANRKVGASLRAIRPSLPRLDRASETGAGRVRCIPPPNGGSGEAIRQPLACHSHDARNAGGARLSLRQRGQYQPCAERVAL